MLASLQGQIAHVAAAVERLDLSIKEDRATTRKEFSRIHDDIADLRTKIASHEGVSLRSIGVVIAIFLTGLGMAAGVAKQWSSLENSRDLALGELVILKESLARESASIARLTRIETTLDLLKDEQESKQNYWRYSSRSD